MKGKSKVKAIVQSREDLLAPLKEYCARTGKTPTTRDCKAVGISVNPIILHMVATTTQCLQRG